MKREGTRRRERRSKQVETSDGFSDDAMDSETETDKKHEHVAMETTSSISLNGIKNLYVQSVCANAATVLLGHDLPVGTVVRDLRVETLVVVV